MPTGFSSKTPAATATSSYAICCRLGASPRHQRYPAIPFPHLGGKRSGNGRIELHSRPGPRCKRSLAPIPTPTVGPIGPQPIVDVADMDQAAGVLGASGVVESWITSAVEHDVMLVSYDGGEVPRSRSFCTNAPCILPIRPIASSAG